MAWLGVNVGSVPVDLTLVAKPSMTDSVLPDSDSNRRSTASASATASVADPSVVDMWWGVGNSLGEIFFRSGKTAVKGYLFCHV